MRSKTTHAVALVVVSLACIGMGLFVLRTWAASLAGLSAVEKLRSYSGAAVGGTVGMGFCIAAQCAWVALRLALRSGPRRWIASLLVGVLLFVLMVGGVYLVLMCDPVIRQWGNWPELQKMQNREGAPQQREVPPAGEGLPETRGD